jgi:cell division septation protein DedD
LAQDDYQYEIQLSNKQLVFYFMAGATALILSFLAGVMVGKGVNADLGSTQVGTPTVTVETSPETAPSREPSYSYAQRLESNHPAERLEGTSGRPVRATPPPPMTPTPPPATPTPPLATPTPRRATPTPTATPRPTPTTAPTVRATPLPSTQGGRISLQVGAFKDEKAAIALRTRLVKSGFPVFVVSRPERDYAVRVGPYASRAQVEQVKKRLLAQEKLSSFVVTQ